MPGLGGSNGNLRRRRARIARTLKVASQKFGCANSNGNRDFFNLTDYRLSELGLPLKVFPACIVAQEQPAQLQPSMQDVYASVRSTRLQAFLNLPCCTEADSHRQSRFFSEQKPDVFLPNDVLVDSLLGHGHLDNGRESRSGNLLAANPGYIPEGKTLADPAFDVLAFATGENSNELSA